MKRKSQSLPETTIAPQIIEAAKAALFVDRAKRPIVKCSVCASATSPNSAEGLCWVCRRLKISAWRDSDTQMPAQE